VSGDAGEPALLARGVAVDNRRGRLLDLPELAVEQGETLSVVGPNGAGKSTLLRVLGLLETPTRGELWFRGEPISRDHSRLLALRRRMAIVFQDPLLCRTTVSANVALGLTLRGVPRTERKRRVDEWLVRFGIAHLANRSAHRISGGEAQRTSLARAFVLQPEILLLDEPFAALDPPSRQALVAELQELLAETHTTTVFVTHDRDEAFALGDRVAVLLDGALAQIGSPEQVWRHPASEGVARFLGMETLLTARVLSASQEATTIAVEGLRLTAASPAEPGEPGEEISVCLRAEDVSLLADEEVPPAGSWNVVPGAVKSLAFWGTQLRVAVDCGVTFIALTTRLQAGELGLRAGRPVRVAFSPDSLHVIRKRTSRGRS
jgi:tungstate transport system ATP-binding protein